MLDLGVKMMGLEIRRTEMHKKKFKNYLISLDGKPVSVSQLSTFEEKLNLDPEISEIDQKLFDLSNQRRRLQGIGPHPG